MIRQPLSYSVSGAQPCAKGMVLVNFDPSSPVPALPDLTPKSDSATDHAETKDSNSSCTAGLFGRAAALSL
jgi:hypothetical protein